MFGKIFLWNSYLWKKILLKINLRNKKKWQLSCSYNPKKIFLSNHIAELSKSLDLFTTKYERFLFLGDFNEGIEDSSIKIFCSNLNLTSMINKPTFYKNPDKPTFIDLISTNCPASLQSSCVIETGLSDFHKMKELRTNLRNKFLKNRSNENKTNYVKKRNQCVSLLRNTKREHYSNLDEKKICVNKTFC